MTAFAIFIQNCHLRCQQSVARCSDGPGQKRSGRAAAAWLVLGSKKVQVPSKSRKKSGRKQQGSGCRPWRVHRMQAFRSEGSDGRQLLRRESSSRGAILRQQAGRAQSKSRRERPVVKNLLSENPPSWLLELLLFSFFLGTWVTIMWAPPGMAVSLEISPHKRLFYGHLDATYLPLSRCPWPCPSVVPSDKGFPNPWSGLAWTRLSVSLSKLWGNGVKEWPLTDVMTFCLFYWRCLTVV